MRAVILALALVVLASCTNDPATAFVGLWAGTLDETDTNLETGEVRTFTDRAINVRIRQDADGLYIDGMDCEVILRADTTTRVRILPSICTTSMGRVEILGDGGDVDAAGILTLTQRGTFFGSPAFSFVAVSTLERTE